MQDFPLPFAVFDRQCIDLFIFFGISTENFENIAANGLLACPAIDTLGSLIPKENFALEVANENRIARLVQKRCLLRDLRIGLLALGDVLVYRNKVFNVSPVIPDRGDGHFLVIVGSILAPVDHFPVPDFSG